MNAKTQYKLSGTDLEVILSIVRTGTLAHASEKLGVDASTIFRSIQRIERGLGQRLFERSRSGYAPLELAQSLAVRAEQLESVLESARSIAQMPPEHVSGTVRVTTTDTILHGLIAPVLGRLHAEHPQLTYEMHTGNELVSLTKRDADIAVRATKSPPQHLIGKYVGSIRVALFASKSGPIQRYADLETGKCQWIAPDVALPEHPSVIWRKRHFPEVIPAYQVHSILTVLEFIALGLGVGALPIFLTQRRRDLLQLTDVIDECETDLWLLAHPDSRHSRRVATVLTHLSEQLKLD